MLPSDRATPDIIDQIYLRGAGGLVQLANVVTVTETVAPKELNHFNRVRSATITANLAPGVGIDHALNEGRPENPHAAIIEEIDAAGRAVLDSCRGEEEAPLGANDQ